MTMTAAADGSSLGNPGPAGWAWYVDEDTWDAGGWPQGTNNLGELTAILRLLQATAETGEELHILADSQYAINVVSKWRLGWKKRGWTKADKKPIKNLELIQEIDRAMEGRRVTFEWVKGHAGHHMNERVIENIKAVEEIGGATGVVATAPFYALGGETEVERHFRILKENTSLELWAYDIPVCVHTKLSPDLLMRLGRDGVIDGVKDSSGDDVAFRWLCLANEAAGHPMQLLTGHEVVVDGAYMSGADGSVPGLANVDPEGYVRQWQAYERRDWEAVRTEQDRLAELMRIVQVKGVQGFGAGVGAFKAALHLLGVFDSPEMPRPVAAIEGDNMEHVASVLRAVDLLS